MGFIVDNKVKVERREFLTVTAINHKRLDSGDYDGSAE